MAEYQLAVIGGGPGGYVAAIRGAQKGLRTVLFEKDEVGGVCLNRGCIPTKALLHSAEVYRELQHAGRYGITTGGVGLDYKAVARRKDDVVKKLRNGVEALLAAHGVSVVRAEAALAGPKAVVAAGQRYGAEHIILATGAAPASLPVPGGDLAGVLDSDAFLALEALPTSMVIIGGGVIGIELASVLSAFGSSVTVIEMAGQILPGLDADVEKAMREVLAKQGVQIYTGAHLEKIEPGYTCAFTQGGAAKTVLAAKVLLAVGRRATTHRLGLQEAGVANGPAGIPVDERMRTNVPGIYAVGDVNGGRQLAHVASAQALVAVGDIVGEASPVSFAAVPACIYTWPEIATVGLTQEEAKATGQPVRTGSFPVAANGRSAIIDAPTGLAKLYSNATTGEILGAQIMAPRATDMIAEIAAVMVAEGTARELAATIHPHPTVSEMLMEAAHDLEGESIHKMPNKAKDG